MSEPTPTSTETPVVSVVIPSYNRKESVLALLADLYKQEGIPFEVIVVDDCSPDGSASAIAEAFPQATLLINETNGGPCVARNRGIRAARAEIIVGLDSDVRVPDPTLLRRTAETFTRLFASIHILAFRLLEPDGVSDDEARWWHPVRMECFASKEFATTYFSGTAYAARRSAVLAAGLYPEVLYMHYEEFVLALRVLDKAGTILYAPELVVTHCARASASRTRIQTFYKPRNQILVALLLYSPSGGLLFTLPRMMYNFLAAMCAGHLRDFAEAMASAAHLSSNCLSQRSPLSAMTRKRVASIANGK